MQDGGRIPVSWSQRWQRFRQKVLPVVTFAACVTCTALLWQRHGATPTVLGEVEVMRVDVVSAADGVLLPLPNGEWTLFDDVERDQVIARLDDRLVRAELEANQRELLRLRDELTSVAEEAALEDAERQQDYDREAVRLAWELQERRLTLLDRRTAIEADKVEVRRLTMRMEALDKLVEKAAAPALEALDTRFLRDTVQRRIETNEAGLVEAQKQLEIASKRVESYPERVRAHIDRLIAPIRAEIAVQESLVQQFRVQVELLEVRAPFSGKIAAIYAWPGQTTRAGQPIVALAANEGRWVVSYVRDDMWFRPQVGQRLNIRTRHERPVAFESQVERVGPQVELIAQHHLRNPKYPEWGIPVRITMPPEARLRPGELVDIRFDRTD